MTCALESLQYWLRSSQSKQIIISASVAARHGIKEFPLGFLFQDLSALHFALFFKGLEVRLPFIHSFIHPLWKYLLSNYSMLGTVLGPEDTAMSKTGKPHPSWSLHSNEGERQKISKQMHHLI